MPVYFNWKYTTKQTKQNNKQTKQNNNKQRCQIWHNKHYSCYYVSVIVTELPVSQSHNICIMQQIIQNTS